MQPHGAAMGRIAFVMLVFVSVCMITHRGNWKPWKKIAFVPAALIVHAALQVAVAIGLADMSRVEGQQTLLHGDRLISLLISLPILIFAMRYSRLFVRRANGIASQTSDPVTQSVDLTNEVTPKVMPAPSSQIIEMSSAPTTPERPKPWVQIQRKDEDANEHAPTVVTENVHKAPQTLGDAVQRQPRLRISAKEIVADIKMGMTTTGLKEKYGLTDEQVQRVFTKLMDKGLLKKA